MENEVYWNLELSIKAGKYDDLLTLVGDMSAHTKANEDGTLNYEWTVNAEKSECHVYERYADSNALLTHMGGFKEHFAGRFFDALDIKRWHVYGNASDQVKEAMTPLGAVFLDRVGGFTR